MFVALDDSQLARGTISKAHQIVITAQNGSHLVSLPNGTYSREILPKGL